LLDGAEGNMTQIVKIRRYIKDFDFNGLFEELGWDRFNRSLSITVDDRQFALTGVREKRGFQVFHYLIPDGETFPSSATMTKMQRAVAKTAHENLVIISDASQTRQCFRIARRDEGKFLRSTGLDFHRGHTGEALAQRLSRLAVSLDEEDDLTLIDVTNRTKDLYAERVTKKFFTKFQQQRDAFKGFIKGIKDVQQRDWYASLMLNRLMFVYFVQKKGFLDRDFDYLKNRLAKSRQANKDFHSFYQYFLLRLFHEGLNKRPDARDPELEVLLGEVPYLNGGIFGEHEIEQLNSDIKIPDKAFADLFAFFDEYQWYLDNRELRSDREINPDVLGYIFEKYINQKQMGAYYTKEDITEYISKNTILAYLIDEAARRNGEPFRPEREVWALLRDDPDRYIYDAVGHGIFVNIHTGERLVAPVPLPDEIAAGIDDITQRTLWNNPAPPEFALPTETWREHIARRERCLELRRKLASGEVTAINDMITLNLDIRRFVQDVIDGCESPDLLSAIYTTIAGRAAKLGSNANPILPMSVLDPTCGSGAFLFAALNILQPLYASCLDKMEQMLVEAEGSGVKLTTRLKEFQKILAEVAKHPNRTYFVLKSIIINNLFGVDIMPEAVEICKLRLFLQLMSTVEPDYAKENLGVEALPDIDFNIRAGNSLVGYTTLEEIERSLSGSLGYEKSQITGIRDQTKIVSLRFQLFRDQQTQHGGEVTEQNKTELQDELRELTSRLDEFLAGDYRIDVNKPKKYSEWKKTHQPFHWFVEFFAILAGGGFSVVVGNPPYIECSKVRQQYDLKGFCTISCGNLYALATERSYRLMENRSRFGFIVQSPIVSTSRMKPVRSLIDDESNFVWYSTFDDRPAKLFEHINHCRVAIVLASKNNGMTKTHTTRYHKWYSDERQQLFSQINYVAVPDQRTGNLIPKFRNQVEQRAFGKILKMPKDVSDLIYDGFSEWRIYYKITGVGHWFTFTLQPPRFWRDGIEGRSSRENTVSFRTKLQRDTAFCCLNSSTHYWLYQCRTNCRDFNPADLRFMPISESMLNGKEEFSSLADEIMERLEETSETGQGNYSVGGAVKFQKFRPKMTKQLIDRVDQILSREYGLTDEEADFIQNYDVKYRLGQSDD